MPRIILSVLLFTLFTNVNVGAQDTTKTHPIGLFLAPEIGYMHYNNGLDFFGGCSFMILIRNQFGIGWSISETDSKVGSQRVDISLSGIKAEYTLRPEKAFHFCFSLQSNIAVLSAYPDSMTFHPKNRKVAHFLVLQPGVHAEYNLLKWLRPYLGINYRVAKRTYNETDLSPSFVSGASFGLGLKIGFFNIKIRKKKRQ